MKSERLTKSIKALINNIFGVFWRGSKTEFSNPRRYRLDFIAENTFNRVWSVRFSRVRVLIVSAMVIASIAALMFVLIFFSPVRKLFPGRLEGDLRSRYVDMAMRLDSIEQLSRANDKYMANLRAILSGEIDSMAVASEGNTTYPVAVRDSMLAASEAERNFVTLYEASDRFNLSVLTPIAAEGMAFYSPIPDVLAEPVLNELSNAISVVQPDRLAVSSVYRGTVISDYLDGSGLHTVIIQHPNDFISVYSGLSDCFTTTGAKVLAGERIGHSGNGNTLGFELWHSGSATDPTEYISF